jgi:hypothetical protein
MATTFAWHTTLTLLFQTTTFATATKIRQLDSFLVHTDSTQDHVGGLRANRSLSLIGRQMALLGGSGVRTVHLRSDVFTKLSSGLEKLIAACDRRGR